MRITDQVQQIVRISSNLDGIGLHDASDLFEEVLIRMANVKNAQIDQYTGDLLSDVEDEGPDERDLPEITPFEAKYRPGLREVLEPDGSLDLRPGNWDRLQDYYGQFRGEKAPPGQEGAYTDPNELLERFRAFKRTKATKPSNDRHWGAHDFLTDGGSSYLDSKADTRTWFIGPEEAAKNDAEFQAWKKKNFDDLGRKRGHVDSDYASSSKSKKFKRRLIFDHALEQSLKPRLDQMDDVKQRLQGEMASRGEEPSKPRATPRYTGTPFRAWDKDENEGMERNEVRPQKGLLELFDPKNPAYNQEHIMEAIKAQVERLQAEYGMNLEQAQHYAFPALLQKMQKTFLSQDIQNMGRGKQNPGERPRYVRLRGDDSGTGVTHT